MPDTPTLARPSTNSYAPVRDAEAVELAVLRVLADADCSLAPRRIGELVYGTGRVGRSDSASALGRLNNAKQVTRTSYGFRINDAGRARLDADA
jgi:hypothetical protein